jgi:hypothetical protein
MRKVIFFRVVVYKRQHISFFILLQELNLLCEDYYQAEFETCVNEGKFFSFGFFLGCLQLEWWFHLAFVG